MILYSLDELHDGASIICPNCRGRGIKFIQGNSETDFSVKKCNDCDGKGRVIINLKKI